MGNNRYIPVSVQELVYGSKETGLETSSESFNRHNELLYSSDEAHEPRKDRGSSEGLDTHVLQRISPTDKSLIERPKYPVRGPEEEIGPMEAPQASTSKNLPQKVPKKNKKAQKSNQKGKQKAKSKWKKPYPQNYRIPKREKRAMENVSNITRTLM
ncbi:hypothetical protein O181_098576 [Austropuccinia psidii MF-1]|uniref:Uncharacterized protein n=1 Tax=Austropuccinia psidii MF-1 TaxID=1389203 RepID=A0A9Q3PG30_9BASI|nr:hypothetical protein [Austropuccinia psidii MF-1]